MNISHIQTTTRKYAPLVDRIVDLIEATEITSEDGELLLLHIAGISAGNRQASITGADYLLPLTHAWAFAAEMGEG